MENVISTPHHKKTKIPKFLFIALIVLLSAVSGYFYYQSASKSPEAQKVQAEKDAKEITGKISKFMLLPTDTPAIATVSDKNLLTKQPFFANAENGDKLLIYQSKAQAILYRPSTNMIIAVGPINYNQPATGVAPSVAPVKK